jgi:adenylate cyclase
MTNQVLINTVGYRKHHIVVLFYTQLPGCFKVSEDRHQPFYWKTAGQRRWLCPVVWIASPILAGLVMALRLTGSLQGVEWAVFDQFFRWRPLEPSDQRIVIVGIRESDLQTLGFPIPDRFLAQALENLHRQQPRAIGLDIVRDMPVEPGHTALRRVFETMPELVSVNTVGDSAREAIAPPPVLQKRGQVGFNNLLPDGDEKVRRAILFADDAAGNQVVSLGLKLAMIYLQPEGVMPSLPASDATAFQIGRTTLKRFRANDGSYIRTDDDGFQILLNFRGPADHFRSVSLQDVLQNRIPQNWARDRIVLIGTTASSGKDFFSTPYSGTLLHLNGRKPITAPEQITGVEIHANVTSQLLSAALDGRSPIRIWAEPLEWLWVLFWSLVGAIASSLLRPFTGNSIQTLVLPAGCLVVAGGCLVGICYAAFLGSWWVPLIPPLLALTGSATVLTAYIAHIEHVDRQLVMNLFERHVTPEIAETIWRDRAQILTRGQLPGRKLTATVLFADLRNFTPIAQHTDPETLMNWLNEYLEAMAQVVVAHDGVVDKFIGDSIMAVFGVPIPRTTTAEIAQDARQSVQCALVMGKRLELLNQQWQARGLPTVTMRVGISTGTVVAGSLGGFQKLDYTTIGDNVNVAARLEGYDKSFEKSVGSGVCRILISEETYHHIQAHFATRFVASETLKGRDQLTRIYQVLVD